ncbi:MAG: type II secretion system protein [Candidatus Eremiobacteraeota bacterium]|nr:type II secretion system protein [Candidatus Eremiobacteraeota bacterium]
MRKRKVFSRERGLSILEIIIAVILLAMVIMATACVYPGGYKLNETNKLANQATEIARGIAEEINMRPFYTSNLSGIDALSIWKLAIKNNTAGWTPTLSNTYCWPYHFYGDDNTTWQQNCPVYCWGDDDPANLRSFKTNVLDQQNPPKVFYLPHVVSGSTPTAQNPLPGIHITVFPDFNVSTEFPDNISGTQSRMAKISVTVAWIEFRGSSGLLVPKSVTVTSWRTDNKMDY